MSQPLTDDLYDQIDQLERSNRRWRWLALSAGVGMLVLLLLSCASVGLWVSGRSTHRYPDDFYDMQLQQSAAERSHYEMKAEVSRMALDEANRDLKEARRELEELRKKLPPDKAPR